MEVEGSVFDISRRPAVMVYHTDLGDGFKQRSALHLIRPVGIHHHEDTPVVRHQQSVLAGHEHIPVFRNRLDFLDQLLGGVVFQIDDDIGLLQGEGIRTQAFDPSKLEDPSLIIYAPVRVLGNKTIVTNGDQTDTIYEGMDKQLTFEQSLRSREFEPDGPNYTPRISGIMHIENGKYNYAMSILKSDNGNPDSCLRFTYAYENPLPGEGRFIHTYMHDGNPLPSFQGEPKLVEIPDDMDAFTDMLWNSLNEDNKVSLFVRFIEIETGKYETKIVNKNV